MKKQDGFSLIELLAVILIVSTLLVPLLFSLTSNFGINVQAIRRNSSNLIGISSIQAMNQIDFINYADLLETDDYLVLDRTSCGLLPSDDGGDIASSFEICEMVFDSKLQNEIITNTDAFKIYVYPYFMTETNKQTFLNEADEPGYVLDEMDARIRVISDDDRDFFIYNITVVITYDQDNQRRMITSGELTAEQWCLIQLKTKKG